MIQMMTGDQLAASFLYSGQNAAFHDFRKRLGIQPVPGRRDCYDPIAVREKLNQAQGINSAVPAGGRDVLEMSRKRRNVS